MCCSEIAVHLLGLNGYLFSLCEREREKDCLVFLHILTILFVTLFVCVCPCACARRTGFMNVFLFIVLTICARIFDNGNKTLYYALLVMINKF